VSLSDLYQDLEESETTGNACKTCKWYAALPPDDRSFFDRALTDPTTNLARLLRACKSAGLDVVHSSLRNHIANHHRQAFDPNFGGLQ